jgi:dihydroflavonol-4-reductase
MRVLVTGASGFIGGNLVRELLRQGYEVRALVRPGSNLKALQGLKPNYAEGDLLDRPSLDQALAGCQGLFHTAALYAFWSKSPGLIYRTNVQGTENILAAAAARGLQKVVYTSSESAVGISPGFRVGNEEMQGDLKGIAGEYKRSKFIAEEVARSYCARGLPLTIVNPTTPIGAYDVKPTPTGKIVTDYLNHKMFACLETGLNVIDVEDVARGHVLALEKGRPGQRYLLGNRNLSLRDMMLILERIAHIPAPRLNIPYWLAMGAGYLDGFVEGTCLRRYPRIPPAAVKAARKVRHFDCGRAVQELGLPQTSVEIAFEKAVRWFRDNGYAK